MKKTDESEAAVERPDHHIPMTLNEAAQRYGLPSKSTIVTEAKRGNIVFTWLGNRRYVTERDMLEMFEKCRAESSRPASNSGNAKAANPSTSSETVTTSGAQALALSAAKMLRQR